MKLKKYLENCNEVYHTTIDPKGPGVVRIHLVPPQKMKVGIPWVVILNGYYLIPLHTAWAILLKIYIDVVSKTDCDFFLDETYDKVATEAHEIFNQTKKSVLEKDIKDIIETFQNVARGRQPKLEIGYMSLAQYGKYMSAPHRLDLMVSSMTKDGKWACNQKCLHCYAADEVLSSQKELNTYEWFEIIDAAKKAHIPQLTFTGGEPTLREDLPDLVQRASWFVTRVNTNGVALTKELCKKLYDASLDSIQITFYSYDEKIHNKLVGANNFKKTVEGIQNALEAGLDVSVNTPLCSLNKDYLKTIQYLQKLGVTYFSSSGLIPTGKAKEVDSKITALSKQEITNVIKEAYEYTSQNELEISFTSPGWINEKALSSMKMVVPSCGACLSNMAVSPSGDVIPCQSWLSGLTFGNMLQENWKDIWNHPECIKRRKESMKNLHICPLKEANHEKTC